MVKRSPRYPRQSLSKSLEMVKKMFDGAHQSKMDMNTAARVLGYSNSASGAASSALGSLRQFGLVDGLRGDIAVSDLAMRILQPLADDERVTALHEAAMKPEVFERVTSHFGGRLPPLDEPIRAFLIRQEGFSSGGADEVVGNLRETISSLPEKRSVAGARPEEFAAVGVSDSASINDASEQTDVSDNFITPIAQDISELITLPLGANCKVELRFMGNVTHAAYDRLIRHLELLRDMAAEDMGESNA